MNRDVANTRPMATKPRDRNRSRTACRLAARLLFGCLLAAASPLASASDCGDPVAATTPASSAGLRVHVDPETGELLDHPPADEQPEPAPEIPAAGDIPVEVRPDGTVVADIGDRYRTVLHAEVVGGRLVTCHRPLSEAESDAGTKVPEGGDEP